MVFFGPIFMYSRSYILLRLRLYLSHLERFPCLSLVNPSFFSLLFLFFARSEVALYAGDCSPLSLSLSLSLSENLVSMLDLIAGETDLVVTDPAHAVNSNPDQELSLIGRVVTNRDLSINFIRGECYSGYPSGEGN